MHLLPFLDIRGGRWHLTTGSRATLSRASPGHVIGVSQDASSSVEWYKKAAQAGDVIAMRQIGVLYDKGRGVPVDYVEAVKWYKAAAERGDSQAQHNFGILMYYGVGTERNEEQGKD